MDEVFWVNVVKRWSDASENVIILKKELSKVQEERNLYRNLLQNLQRSDTSANRYSEYFSKDHTSVHSAPILTDHDDAEIQDELQGVEAGLTRAKEEYNRLQQELSASVEKIKELQLENEKLFSNHQLEVQKLSDEICNVKASKTQDIMPVQQASTARSTSMTTAINQIEILERAVKDHEADKKILQDELALTKEKLHKSEENSKVLLSTIVKLQGIARHSIGSNILHSISNSLLPPDSRGPSRKTSFASTRRSLAQESDDSNRSTIKNMRSSPQLHVDERIDVPPLPLFLPPARAKILLDLPPVPKTLIDTSDNTFDRDILKNALGDSMQSPSKHLPGSIKNKKATISSYLCPTLNHHPWCPSNIGQHGYIFVGLGKEKNAYKTSVIRNLFVGLPKSQTNIRAFRYLGKYRVSRVDPLSVDEWNTLSSDIKFTYSKITKEKAQDDRSIEDILKDYDAGQLVVPCVELQFMSFDEDFYTALLSFRKSG